MSFFVFFLTVSCENSTNSNKNDDEVVDDKETVDELIQKQDDFFNSHTTLRIDFRLKHLNQLKQAIKNHEPELIAAFRNDLGKGEFESLASEIGLIQFELTQHIKHMKKWARPEVVKTPLHAFPSKSYIYKQSYGH